MKNILLSCICYFFCTNTINAQVLYGTTKSGGNNQGGTIGVLDTKTNTLNTKYSFAAPSGSAPLSSLTQAPDGKLYGMTWLGGTSKNSTNNNIMSGVIFSFDPITSTYTDVKNLDYATGGNPMGNSLMKALDGKFYGMTTSGGANDAGVIFSFDPITSEYKDIKDFDITSGGKPMGSLLQTSDGKLYGMTSQGGNGNSNKDYHYNRGGVIFSFDPNTLIYTVIKNFDGSNGSSPLGSLIQASDGNLYGMTYDGGDIFNPQNYVYGSGVIFSLNLNTSSYKVVKNFDYTSGGSPVGNLIEPSKGKLFGMTSYGGKNGGGVIFSLDLSTFLYQNVKDFDRKSGFSPYGNLMKASDGKLYGTTCFGGTKGKGSVFSIDPKTLEYSSLQNYNGINGSNPFYGSAFIEIQVDLPIIPVQPNITTAVACGTLPVPSSIKLSDGTSLSGLSSIVQVPNTCGGIFTETWNTDAKGTALAPVSRTITVTQNIGAVQDFVFFSSNGAVSNTGSSTITGSVGSNLGAVTGFDAAFDPTSNLTPGIYTATDETMHAQKDLLNLYIHISNIPLTKTIHDAVFGSDEILTAGMYSVAGAGTMAGNLTLNGSSTDLFIFKFNGAFAPAASSVINLTGGATASNVFWIAEGAVSIGADCTMKGTFIAHSGASSMGAGGDLEGRLLSTDGAVSFGPGTAKLPIGATALPIICVKPNNSILGAAANFTLFTSAGAVSNVGTSGFIGNIGTGAGAVTGFDAPSAIISGTTYNTDDQMIATASADLQTAYNSLVNTTKGIEHAAVFGNGENLTSGVYTVGGAASLAGTLTLTGSADDKFTFIINGALALGAQSNIILTGGATYNNVFWVAEGAISTGAFSVIKGNFIAHNGANTMGANSNLEGSLFSTAGAIGVNTGVAYTGYVACVDYNNGSTMRKIAKSVILKNNLSVSTENKLSIYPNPARSIINLVLTGDESKVTSVEIVDVLGKLVYSSKHYQSIINLSNHAAGVYFVRVHLNSKITSTKIVMVK